jgi:hypothetical protein
MKKFIKIGVTIIMSVAIISCNDTAETNGNIYIILQ